MLKKKNKEEKKIHPLQICYSVKLFKVKRENNMKTICTSDYKIQYMLLYIMLLKNADMQSFGVVVILLAMFSLWV